MDIGEIKERFKRYDFVHSYIDEYGCDDEWKDAHEPIGYLLSIIEQAEKALEKFSDDSQWDKQDYKGTAVYVWNGDNGQFNPMDIANEALQAIRK